MSKSALKAFKEKAPRKFDQQDWSSAYCNVEKELENVPLDLIKGEVPQELFGTLYRNGPGLLERGGQWIHHPFDGDGMISSMRFANGKVNFSNRFIRTQAWEEEQKAGRFLYRGVFGTNKSGGLIANIFDLRLKNIANTNVVKLGNKLLALWEAANPHALDPNSLETFGLSSLNGALAPKEALSAHPRFDPGHNNEPCMVTYSVKTGPKSSIRLMEFATENNNAGNIISDRKDTFNGFAFLHDFAITPNWAIFLQNSISFNPIPFILGQKGAAQCLSSQKNTQGKFLLIPRNSGVYAGENPKIFDAPSGFVFHHLNAWEDKNEVILESIYYNDFPSIGPKQDFRNIDFKALPEGQLKRCKINLSSGEIKTTTLSEQCCEFAMVNPNFLGLKARYSWMATAQKSEGNGPLQSIKKLDLITGNNYSWSAGERGFINEPLFVPKEYSNTEDDGWVLVVIWNGETRSSELVVLNAIDLEEKAVLKLPINHPYGLHGSWASSK